MFLMDTREQQHDKYRTAATHVCKWEMTQLYKRDFSIVQVRRQLFLTHGYTRAAEWRIELCSMRVSMSETCLTYTSETWPTSVSETWLTYISETWPTYVSETWLTYISETWLTYVSETCRSWPVGMCVTPSRPLSFHTRTISLCRTSMCLPIFISMSVSMYVSVYVYAYVCVYMCVWVCVRAEEEQCIHGGCSHREGLGCSNFPQGLTHILSLVLSDSISLTHTYICAHMCVSD